MCVNPNLTNPINIEEEDFDGVLLLKQTPFALYSHIITSKSQNDTNLNETKPTKQLLILSRLDLHWDFFEGMIPMLLEDKTSKDIVKSDSGILLHVFTEYKIIFVGLVTVLLFIV